MRWPVPRTQSFLETTEREKTTSTMVDDRQRLRTMDRINQQSTKQINHRKRWDLQWHWFHFRALDPSREIDAPFSHTTNNEKSTIFTTKQAIDPNVGWRWPSTPSDYGKQSTINQKTRLLEIMSNKNMQGVLLQLVDKRRKRRPKFSWLPNTTNQNDRNRSEWCRWVWGFRTPTRTARSHDKMCD